MATQYGFFNKGATDPVYQAAQFDQFIDLLFDSGVVPNYFNQLVVSVTGAGLSVTVATGGAVVNGGYYVNDAPITLAVDAEGAGTNRYDRIVIRKTVATKIIEAAVLKGTSAASPTIPALTQNSAVWEIALKTVYIASGAVTLIAGNLTDTPIYADLFGGKVAGLSNKIVTQATRATNLVGTQIITLSFQPRFVRIHAFLGIASSSNYDSDGSFDGTSQFSIAKWGNGTSPSTLQGMIIFLHSGSGGNYASVIFTSTGITLTWTAEGAALATGNIIMKIEAF